MTQATEVNTEPQTFTFDFTNSRHDHSIIPIIFWTTVAFFLLSIPTHWLGAIFGIPQLEAIHEWMFATFSMDPGKVMREPWLLITHMFMHGGLLHFGMNMLILYMFYRSAKEFFPGRTWLIIYFAAGIAGGLLYALFNEAGAIMVGASGGVMGLWGAAIAARIRYRFVPDDERPWQCNLTLVVLLQYLALQAVTEFLIPNVAHSAHAGGLIAGFIIGGLLPLWQQPRLVTMSPGAFDSQVEIVKRGLERFVQKYTATATDAFDPQRDFLAVEYDSVDCFGRRKHWYETAMGTMPEGLSADNLAVLASARQVGKESPEEYLDRSRREAGQAPEEPAKKDSQNSSFSLGYLIAVVGYLVLANIEIPRDTLMIMFVAGAIGCVVSWFFILKETFRLNPVASALTAGILIGGSALGCFYLDFIEIAARLMVAVAASFFVPRILYRNKK